MSSDRTRFEIRVILPLALVVLANWVAWQAVETAAYRPNITATNFGYTPNPAGTREFLAELEHPTFGDAAREVVAKD